MQATKDFFGKAKTCTPKAWSTTDQDEVIRVLRSLEDQIFELREDIKTERMEKNSLFNNIVNMIPLRQQSLLLDPLLTVSSSTISLISTFAMVPEGSVPVLNDDDVGDILSYNPFDITRTDSNFKATAADVTHSRATL
ncbi:hypothetical protein UCRPC4_g06267 [Phaeomoniella chlamydospora]|uniref:Uncharacterized protein n=1 Tax=Phaeomoniella chlamydospora TaxID=158046 RepID=A0A0G2GEW0_PHACM|nr:hypothetical protein UCRPC4_g06267 [Phaeomoniella chlamydospora]